MRAEENGWFSFYTASLGGSLVAFYVDQVLRGFIYALVFSKCRTAIYFYILFEVVLRKASFLLTRGQICQLMALKTLNSLSHG